ncbi:hypothetical protein BKA56DRAFT_584889 [Ilyonectria sp. MPI-CAGE-AT-0026]|nr:hypothetical protein BKA56DRAFT_584889 [Ilyonectria sp. MPI-CAGE-AT-0026]
MLCRFFLGFVYQLLLWNTFACASGVLVPTASLVYMWPCLSISTRRLATLTALTMERDIPLHSIPCRNKILFWEDAIIGS